MTASGVTVRALDSGDISATSAAAAIAATLAELGLSISGAGAESTNRIGRTTDASIERSTLTSRPQTLGDVTIEAEAIGEIDATVVAVDAAIATDTVSLGVSVARNLIGYERDDSLGADFTTDDGREHVRKGDTVKVLGGPRTGDVYEYVASDSQTIDLAGADFSDPTVWQQLGLSPVDAGVRAFALGSSIDVHGDLVLRAHGRQRIDATVVGVSVGFTLPSALSIAVAGVGVFAQNKIHSGVLAFIDGDGATGISAETITLTAKDESSVKALAGAVSVAAAVGGVSVSGALSIGISIALNEVDVDVDASIRDADQLVRSTGGSIELHAIAVGDALFSFTGTTTSELDELAAEPEDHNSTRNEIRDGFEAGGIDLSSKFTFSAVQPGVVWQISDTESDRSDSSTWFLTRDGNRLVVSAPTIDAIAFAASLGVALGGGGVAAAISGAAAYAVNAITSDATARIDDSVLASADDVVLEATSASRINALVLGISAALAVSVGAGGVGASIGVVIARNRIGYDGRREAVAQRGPASISETRRSRPTVASTCRRSTRR